MAPVAERICRLPVDFASQNKSPMTLVEESGYLDRPDELSRSAAAQYLRSAPHLVDAWEGYSDDQRCSPAWVFLRTGAGYLVFRMPDGAEMRFDDPFEACAEFIMRHMDEHFRKYARS